MTVSYGDKGCRCWRDEDYNPWDDRTHGDWLPSASCRFHGALAPYAPPRRDTGTYQVVDLDLPSGRIVEHREVELGQNFRLDLRGEPGPELVPWPTTTEEERGVFAAVRRWWGHHNPFARRARWE